MGDACRSCSRPDRRRSIYHYGPCPRPKFLIGVDFAKPGYEDFMVFLQRRMEDVYRSLMVPRSLFGAEGSAATCPQPHPKSGTYRLNAPDPSKP